MERARELRYDAPIVRIKPVCIDGQGIAILILPNLFIPTKCNVKCTINTYKHNNFTKIMQLRKLMSILTDFPKKALWYNI